MANLNTTINIKSMDIFKEAINLLKEISEREDVPKDIKDKVKEYVARNNKS